MICSKLGEVNMRSGLLGHGQEVRVIFRAINLEGEFAFEEVVVEAVLSARWLLEALELREIFPEPIHAFFLGFGRDVLQPVVVPVVSKVRREGRILFKGKLPVILIQAIGWQCVVVGTSHYLALANFDGSSRRKNKGTSR